MEENTLDRVRETYLAAFADNRKARIRETDKRDSVFAMVNSSSLILSVSFFTLSGFGSTESKWLLISSWILFLVALVLQLLSYIFVEWHFVQSERNLKDWYSRDGTKPFPKEHGSWGITTFICNYLGYLFTILGLAAMTTFGWYNIGTMSKHNDDGKKFANPLVNNPITPNTNPFSPSQEPPQSKPPSK